MPNIFTSWMARRRAEQDLDAKRLQVEHAAVDKALSALQEATNMVTERPDTGGWVSSSTRENVHLQSERDTMLRQARSMYRFDVNARAVLSNMVYYIMGEGVKITPKSDDPRQHRLWKEFWESPRNKMSLKQSELVLRTLRDGECLLQFYNKDEMGLPSWKTTVRFRDPDLMRTPPLEYTGPGGKDLARDGVEVDPEDNEKALRYFISHSYENMNNFDIVPASDMLHIKVMADSEQKRGESFIQPAMEYFGQYKEWLKYRIVLNKVRTAVVLVRKVSGSSVDVGNIQGSIGLSRTAKSGETKKRMPPPGTVLNANNGVDYEFKAANINAADAAEDGRQLKLGMAAGTNNPEYVFGDASNANYASTLIAESPFVKSIRYWQTFFEFYFKEIYRHVMQAAVDAGKLTAPPEEDIFTVEGEDGKAKAVSEDDGEGEGNKASADDPLHEISEQEKFWGCDAQWPEIIHRDLKETISAVIGMRDAGLISDPTATAIAGYDYEEEVRKQQMVEENADNNPFLAGRMQSQADAGDMDAELQDMVKGLTPEESDKILKSNDPKEVLAAIKNSKNGKKARADA